MDVGAWIGAPITVARGNSFQVPVQRIIADPAIRSNHGRTPGRNPPESLNSGGISIPLTAAPPEEDGE